MELLVKRELSGEEAAIECGQGEFEIVGIELAGFFDRPRTRTGTQADVPHTLDNGSYGFLGLFLGFLVGEGEEHVDVGVREEIFASVAAQGQQRNILCGLTSKGPSPHFNEDAVNHSGAAADRSSSISGTLTGLADKRHLPEILIP